MVCSNCKNQSYFNNLYDVNDTIENQSKTQDMHEKQIVIKCFLNSINYTTYSSVNNFKINRIKFTEIMDKIKEIIRIASQKKSILK